MLRWRRSEPVGIGARAGGGGAAGDVAQEGGGAGDYAHADAVVGSVPDHDGAAVSIMPSGDAREGDAEV